MSFSQDVAEDLVLKAARCCCLCRQFKGQKLEIHHIKPEADDGPSTPENGIPLCFDCHADVASYNEKHPRGRKYRRSELRRLRDEWFALVASGKTGGGPPAALEDDDVELVRFYSQCFDRPAFQDPFREEGAMEAFDKAIEDTITAINTGCLRARDGAVLAGAKGKSHLKNAPWRIKMDTIVDLLRAIRSRYSLALATGQLHIGGERQGQQFYCIHDHDLADWMDVTRGEVVRLFNEICDEAAVPNLQFPRRGRRRPPDW